MRIFGLGGRNSSGDVRAFRTVDVFIFNTLGFALGLVVSLTPSFLSLQQPKAGVVETLSVGFVVCLINGLLYAEIAGAMPRSGGDYVFISRVLSPAVGFCANWGLTWSQLFGAGAYTCWTISTALAPAMVILGRTHDMPDLEKAGRQLSSTPLALAGATSLLLLVAILFSIRGLLIVRRILMCGFFLALLGTAIAGFSLFRHSPFEVYDLVNDVLATRFGTPDLNHLVAAFQATNHPPIQPVRLSAAFLALPIGYWAYLGFTYSVYVGAEVRVPRRSQYVGIIGALMFGFVAYGLLLGRYYHVLGREGVAAIAFAEKNAPDSLPVASGFMMVIASIVPSGWIGTVAVFSFALWYFLLVIVMVQVCARNVISWSTDELLPSWLAEQSSVGGAPRKALVTVGFVAVIFALLVSYNRINFVNYVALFVTCYLATGIAAMLLPLRRPEFTHKAAGQFVAVHFNTLRIVTLGILNTVIFAFILVTALLSPDFSGVPATWIPPTFLAAVYIAGATVFFLARRRKSPLEREIQI